MSDGRLRRAMAWSIQGRPRVSHGIIRPPALRAAFYILCVGAMVVAIWIVTPPHAPKLLIAIVAIVVFAAWMSLQLWIIRQKYAKVPQSVES